MTPSPDESCDSSVHASSTADRCAEPAPLETVDAYAGSVARSCPFVARGRTRRPTAPTLRAPSQHLMGALSPMIPPPSCPHLPADDPRGDSVAKSPGHAIAAPAALCGREPHRGGDRSWAGLRLRLRPRGQRVAGVDAGRTLSRVAGRLRRRVPQPGIDGRHDPRFRRPGDEPVAARRMAPGGDHPRRAGGGHRRRGAAAHRPGRSHRSRPGRAAVVAALAGLRSFFCAFSCATATSRRWSSSSSSSTATR